LQAALRVGVVLERAVLSAWQYRCVAELALDPRAQLVVVAWLRGAPLAPPGGLAVRAYERVDRAIFQTPRDPLTPVDATELLADVPALEVRAIPRGDGFELDPEALEALRGHQLDVLLQVGGGGPLEGTALAVARLGLWSFGHEDQARCGIPPFFSELVASTPVSETRLVARSAAGTRVLLRSVGSTNANSLHRNRVGALWKSSLLPARAVGAFAAGREPPFDGGASSDATDAHRRPGPLAIARLGWSIAARVARNRAKLRRADRVWFIALRRRAAESVANDPLAGFVQVPLPADRFYADPMLVRVGDEHHLFFEDADRATGLGAISWCAVHSDGTTGPVRRILEADTHHSYPFVFAWRGAYYMIPETSEKRTVELYRAIDFPLRWQLEKVIFQDVAAVDTTVFEHRGRLWLFAAMSPSGAALNDELFLFHAEDLGGEWRAHPMNPIVSDVRRARPAGPLFWEGDALYRPGQDCAGDYGAAFWLNRIDELDEQRYRETPVRRIDPSWYPGGVCTHTYTRAGDFEAMDNRLWVAR
jgi:hypothetical protein